jgi:RimJ/RimL family protein N-acetyltransferase
MRIVYGQDAVVADWAGEMLGLQFSAPYVAIGFSRDGMGLHGAAVFNGWNGSNIDLTVYGPGPWTRGCLAAVFGYVFNQLGARRLTVRTARGNKSMLRLLPRLGFAFEGVARRWYGPNKRDDGVQFAMYPERAAKWMPHGLAIAARAA